MKLLVFLLPVIGLSCMNNSMKLSDHINSGQDNLTAQNQSLNHFQDNLELNNDSLWKRL
jgi:hypothetical protein